MIDEMQLSTYGRNSVTPAPVSRMMAEFSRDFRPGIDINLGVGYVNESTIPHRLIEEALQAINRDPEKYRGALNYGDPKGSARLIEAIRRFLLEHKIGNMTADVLDKNEIIIGPSGTTSLLEAIAHLIPPGIVLTSDPMYYIYCHFLERLGFQVVAVPENEQGIDTQRLQEKIDGLGPEKDAIRFFYVVTISNPTCTILSNVSRRALVAIASGLSKELGRKIPVFLDKAYENLVHDSAVEEPESALLYDELGMVYEVATLSKVLAPALRVGYMIGPEGPFMKAMIQKGSDVGFSAPLVNQEITGYLLNHHITAQLDRVNQGYRDKAVQVRLWIDEYLGSEVEEIHGGQAGFYYYLTLRNTQTHESSPFFRYLTRTTGKAEIDGAPGSRASRVLYIPGVHCVHGQGELTQIGKRQLRLSYGFEELDRIEPALSVMRKALGYAHK